MKKVLMIVAVAVLAFGATSCKKCKDCETGLGGTVELCGDDLEEAEDAGADCN